MHLSKSEDSSQTAGDADGGNTTSGGAPQRPLLFCRDDRVQVPPAAAHKREADEVEPNSDYDILRQPGFWITILFPSLPIVAGCVFVWFMLR
jgi:hypothetical protein